MVNWFAYASLGNAVYDAGDMLIDSGSFGPLLAGDDAFPVYAGTWPPTAGTYYVVVRLQVADDGAIPVVASPGVAVADPPPPDYTASFSSAIPWSGLVGTAINLTGTTQITISNTEAVPGHVTITWAVHLSTDMVLDVGDTLLKQGSIGPLAGFGSSVADFGTGGVNWPVPPWGIYYFIASVYAVDDSRPTNDVVVASHICATGDYRYLELAENNNGNGTNPPLAQTSPTLVSTLGANQTMVIEAVMDGYGLFDTFRFATIASTSRLSMRAIWVTGFDDLDLYLWDTGSTNLSSLDLGIDSEPGYGTFNVTG